MGTEGVGRVMQRIDEIRSRIECIMGPMKPDQSFQAALDEAESAGDGAALSAAPDELAPMIRSAAAKYNLPARLVEAVARRESGFNARAVSPKGAQGLMQIMPETQKLLGVADPFDPAQSIDGGARYLRMMMDRFGGDVTKALAAYNAGPEAVSRHGGVPPYQETRNYVGRILDDLGALDNE